MIVKATEGAEADLVRINAWWRENREAAPELFWDEFLAVRTRLGTLPITGSAFRNVRGRAVRRTLMPKTRHYVYHYVLDDETVVIAAIWGTSRGDEPPLEER